MLDTVGRRKNERTKAGTSDVLRQAELAGMTVEGAHAARLGRRINTGALLRPHVVALDADRGVLKYDTRQPVLADISMPEVLDRFIALADAPDQELEDFARQGGVLSPEGFLRPGQYEERLDDWRHWAGQGRVVLRIAASLHQDRLAGLDEWKALGLGAPMDEPWAAILTNLGLTGHTLQLHTQRNVLADMVNVFIELAEVRPCFSWWPTASGITFTNIRGPYRGAMTLSGVLALQLVLACYRADSISACSGCGTPYLRRWHSPTGRRNYCEECGERAAWRDSKRRRRAESSATGQSRKRKRGAR